MNPWTFYEHKPQLAQAVVVGVASAFGLRRHGARRASLAALAGVAWASVGLVDWVVYSFGYSLAGWSARDTQAIHATLEWIRVPIAAVAAWALMRWVGPSVGARKSAPP